MKNLLTSHRLKVITLILSAYGIVNELSPILFPKISRSVGVWLFQYKLLHLNFLSPRYYTYHDFDSMFPVNFLILGFCVLMLVGTILFWMKDRKEIRLLRFCLAILLVTNCVSALNVVIMVSTRLSNYLDAPLGILGLLATIVKLSFMIYVSWFGLRILGEMRSIVFARDSVGAITETASRWHRSFNFVVDTFVAALIFFPFLFLYTQDLAENLARGLGERPVIFLGLLVARMLYYPFFETLLGATPAKLFSETRVVNRVGGKISLDLSIYRTLSRFVPFEPFSFFGNSGGWHDRWTDTSVVKEVREGVRGIRYILVVPAMIVIGFAGITAREMYRDHLAGLREQEKRVQRVAEMDEKLKRLSTNTIIKLRSSSYDFAYIKPEDIDGDELYVAIFRAESNYVSPFNAGQNFRPDSESVGKTLIKKSVLMEAFERYESTAILAATKVSLLNDDKTYEIEEVFEYGCPVIKVGHGGSMQDNFISLAIDNCGWPGVLKQIKTVKGDATFESSSGLPYSIEAASNSYNSCTSLNFQSNNYERGAPYAFHFVVTDESGRDHTYEVSGTDFDRTVREIFQ